MESEVVDRKVGEIHINENLGELIKTTRVSTEFLTLLTEKITGEETQDLKGFKAFFIIFDNKLIL